MVQNLEVGEPFGNSDHRIIRWKLVLYKEIEEGKEMHKADYDKIMEEAEGINWMDLVGEDSINKDWENVKANLDNMKIDYIPIRRQNRNKCKWANRETTKCRRAKEKAWKRYRMLKDDATYEKYKKKLSAANKSNKEAQKVHFAKAFDKVSHARLLKKLEAHGIERDFTRWLKDWLGGRRQKVNINGKLSGWANVMSGVPQGSVIIIFDIH